ncbi:alpha/beta-hydrolase, partial [Athelia psychrophila]
MASVLVLLAVLPSALGQVTPITGSWPHNYTGIPSGGYSASWQKYFEVTKPLPNVTEPIARSFAGNILTTKKEGSLTQKAGYAIDEEPWLIWLNGGPGASSFIGFFEENGPLEIQLDYSFKHNNYSWSKQADTFWIDQPAGTGYSTTDADGYVGEDFVGFLSNLVKVFPNLAMRPLYLTGESYAGRYIPYIGKALYSMQDAPVKLRKIVLGDSSIPSFAGCEEIPVVHVLETWPQIIDFDIEVLEYFKEQSHLCGYDLNLTYPQQGHFLSVVDPAVTVTSPYSPYYDLSAEAAISKARTPQSQLLKRAIAEPRALLSRDTHERRESWKRGLTGRANGTLDPWYGCFLWEQMSDYAAYYVPDALNPEEALDPSVFLNNNRTRAALHAPTSKDWAAEINYPWNSSFQFIPGSDEFGDPSVEPMAFFSELVANASAHGASIVLYSGNDDSLLAPRSNEVVIQNTTFGGIQGFTRKPATPWYNDEGSLAGVVHQERNLTYVLFLGAGHEVPEYQPANAHVFLREFVLGTNATGLLLLNATTPIGGEKPALAGDIIPGGSVVYYGSGVTASSTIAPSATFAAWASYLATATLLPNDTANATSLSSLSSSSVAPLTTSSTLYLTSSPGSTPTSGVSA